MRRATSHGAEPSRPSTARNVTVTRGRGSPSEACRGRVPGHRCPATPRAAPRTRGSSRIGGRSSVSTAYVRGSKPATSSVRGTFELGQRAAGPACAARPAAAAPCGRSRRPSGPGPGRPGAGAAHADVDLGERVQPDRVQRVDEQPQLHPVADGERQPLQQRAPGRVLAAQRLDEAGQPRPVQVQQRARDQLGDPAAAGRGCRRSGRSYIALTSCTPGSVSSGPTMPETKRARSPAGRRRRSRRCRRWSPAATATAPRPCRAARAAGAAPRRGAPPRRPPPPRPRRCGRWSRSPAPPARRRAARPRSSARAGSRRRSRRPSPPRSARAARR